MKNFLEYYYHFLNLTVHERKGYYYFEYHHHYYIFLYTNRNGDEINAIYRLNTNLKKYHKIILNRNNSPITYFHGRQYVLLRINCQNTNIDYLDLKAQRVALDKGIIPLLRNNWVSLIEKKIDYLEYQREHIKSQYQVLDESVDYFIGMAENSISYLNHMVSKPTDTDYLVISHRRICSSKKIFFYNPLNIVIDHKARDISEYLKFLFVENLYDYNTLNKIIISSGLSNYGYQLLYGRMLYPSFYFDIYEKIINDREVESSSYSIIRRTGEYEEYLEMIYKIINHHTKIPSIDWI